jgi:hypothetical protein
MPSRISTNQAGELVSEFTGCFLKAQSTRETGERREKGSAIEQNLK